MSLNLVPYPLGVDYPIGKIQKRLYERAYVNWGASGMTSSNLQVYGRVYRNSAKDGFLPQWYMAGKDYNEDMFFDDRIDCLIYFGLKDPMLVDVEKATYNVEIYCFCNVPRLRPTTSQQRMDEQVIRDVLGWLMDAPFGFVYNSVDRDIDNVLNRYSGGAKNNAIVDNNHQPKLCFRINGTLTMSLHAYNGCTKPIVPQNFTAMTGWIWVYIKDTPNPLLKQTLINGVEIPLEYPSGPTLTIPHLIGRDAMPNVIYNANNIIFPYDESTATYSWPDGSEFLNGDRGLIYYNENS